jgi:tripartite-type tricarboxylate transporter receptor subunit TctC
MVPARTPATVVERLNRATTEWLSRPATRDNLAKQGAQPMPMTPAEFEAFLRRDIETQRRYVQMARIEVN